MATVSGPFLRTESGAGVPPYGFKLYIREQRWFRRKPVTDQPLEYLLRVWTGNGECAPNSWDHDYTSGYQPSLSAQNLKKAYDRLKDAIAEPASLAVSIAERKQAMSMIARRASQLWRFTRALRRGQIVKAAHEVGIAVPSKARDFNVRRDPKKFGDLWLEYHLGWKPLIKDIYSSLDVLQRGFPPFRVRGRSTFTHSYSWSQPPSFGTWLHRESVQLKAKVLVTDPNLWQANQLGLINPAVVVWELVPFSFVVDWFLPVGDFLAQYTDFVGLQLLDSQTTYYTVHRALDDRPANPVGNRKQYKQAVVVQRTYGISNPPLVRNRFTGLSPQRAATAISLLLQQLKG